MKRAYFYLPDRDYNTVAIAVEATGGSFSEFVRQALAEKLDREVVMGQVAQVRQDLAVLVDEFRGEVARTRKDLMDDHQRGMDLVRADIGKSMKKNEEANKTFVGALANALGGVKAKPSTQRQTNGHWDDDDAPPMKVPS